jgi:hypothetical protein
MEESKQECLIKRTDTNPTNSYKVKTDNDSDEHKYSRIKLYARCMHEFDGVNLEGKYESEWDIVCPLRRCVDINFKNGVINPIFTDIAIFIDDHKSIHCYKFNNTNFKITELEKLSITDGIEHPVVIINNNIKANSYKIHEKCGWVGGLAGVNWIDYDFAHITYNPNYAASYCTLM